MAEAVARACGGTGIEARSAGTRPAGLNPLTIRVLEEAGFETAGLRSKAVEEFEGVEFDYIVTLCDTARQECPYLPGRAARLHWDLPDPASAAGDPDSRIGVFREVLGQVRLLVAEFLRSIDGGCEADRQPVWHDGAVHDGIAFLSPREVLDSVSRFGAAIVDIRPGHETSYRQFDLPGAVFVAAGDAADVADFLPRDRLLVVADSVGLKSRAFAERLLDAGFASVAVMVGGMVDWERDGLPVRKDPDYELRGQCGCKLRARGGKPAAESGRQDGYSGRESGK